MIIPESNRFPPARTSAHFEDPAMPEPVPVHDGLSDLVTDYDGLILDVWGVLHDGMQLYPDVLTTLDRLADTGKQIVMLTNAPRRSAVVAQTLIAMGIPSGHCRFILSSGEASYLDLRDRGDPFYRGAGNCFLHIGPERDRSLFSDLGLEETDTVDKAGLIVNTGPWGDEESLSDYEDILGRGAELGLPMLCANPDLEVVRGGRVVICAGTLAAHYEALGGPVRYLGKPRPEIYEYCFHVFDGIDRSRIVAIGDSLRTDIAGACNAGIDSILVAAGIHARFLKVSENDGHPDGERLVSLLEDWNIRPTALIPSLRW